MQLRILILVVIWGASLASWFGSGICVAEEQADRQIMYSDDAGKWWLEPYAGLAWYGREIQGPRLEACFYSTGLKFGPDGRTAYTLGISMLEIPSDGPVLQMVSQPHHPGYADGPAELARFGGTGIIGVGRLVSDLKGGYYVADWGNQCIRRLYRKEDGRWWVETVAGEPARGEGWAEWQDGTLKTARFRTVQNLAVDARKNIVVTDSNRIRYVDLDAGTVTTLNPDWGGKGYSYGCEDGPLAAAKFSWIFIGGCDIDREKNILYVADSWNGRVRRVDLTAKTVGTVWNGKGGKVRDGPLAEGRGGPCHDAAWDPFRRRIVLKEMDCQLLRVIDPEAGTIRSWAGSTDAKRKDLIAAGKIPYPMPGKDANLNYGNVFEIGERSIIVGALGKPGGGGVASGVFSFGRLYLKEDPVEPKKEGQP